jgi:hypothetical protein
LKEHNWLARLAGAQEELLAQTPDDRVKYTALGGVLLSTSAVAGVSAAFALHTAVGLAAVSAVLAGALWAVVILNLDRMLTLSMGRSSRGARNLLTALPRLILAVVIGAVVSTPLVLRIFQPEIESELQIIHSENAVHSQTEMNDRFADIAPLAAMVGHLQGVASGAIRPVVSNDPDVKAATADRNAAQTAYNEAEDNAQCELNGTCGTRIPGVGTAQISADQERQRRQKELDSAQKRLDDAVVAITRSQAASAASDRKAAQQQLDILGPRLDQREKERDRAQLDLDKAEAGDTGLLVRLEALERLSKDHPITRTANIALFLLFMLIEILPVLVKLLLGVGKAPLYERLVARQEEQTESNTMTWARNTARIEQSKSDVWREIEEDRARRQVEAGKDANAALVAEQSSIALESIQVWGGVARKRSREELARWYDEHGAEAALGAAPEGPDASVPRWERGSPTQASGPDRTRPDHVGHHETPASAAPGIPFDAFLAGDRRNSRSGPVPRSRHLSEGVADDSVTLT